MSALSVEHKFMLMQLLCKYDEDLTELLCNLFMTVAEKLFCFFRYINEDKQMKKTNYGILIALICSAILAACGLQEDNNSETYGQMSAPTYELHIEGTGNAESADGRTYKCSMNELNSYLSEFESDSPYFYADIRVTEFSAESSYGNDFNMLVSLSGDAEVTWHCFDSLEQMEDALDERSEKTTNGKVDEETNGEIQLVYYSFPLPENFHALDCYRTLEDCLGTEGWEIRAVSSDNGNMYYFSQETNGQGDGYLYLSDSNFTVQNLVIKNGYAYGLALKENSFSAVSGELDLLFYRFLGNFGRNTFYGWGLNEEHLYWIDHEERITEEEGSEGRFVEVRGIDTNWEQSREQLMRYFGMMKEAVYEVPLSDDGPTLELHFSLVQGISVPDYKIFLLNGFCMDEEYNMTVTDKETGQVLQENTVKLSIELPDTVYFADLNGDGLKDIRIDRPVHISGARAATDKWTPPSYMLWNPEAEQFEKKTEKEVQNSLLANRNGLTEEEQAEKTLRERRDFFVPLKQLPSWANPDKYIELTVEAEEYVVQPGDTLWSISENLLGSGLSWTMLQREGNAPKDPNLLLPGEVIHIPEHPLYIRMDPYSRGGLSSPGRYQIEYPDGFGHYSLTDDVSYFGLAKENKLFYTVLANEMEENALSNDWETFKAEVIRCSEEICQGRVSNLIFEKYKVKDGCDMYGYSFEYDTGDYSIELTCFIRLGKTNMVEVIGVRKKEPNTVLLNTTRYVAASFIDYGQPSNITIGGGEPNVGADDWAYPHLHNLFRSLQNRFGE